MLIHNKSTAPASHQKQGRSKAQPLPKKCSTNALEVPHKPRNSIPRISKAACVASSPPTFLSILSLIKSDYEEFIRSEIYDGDVFETNSTFDAAL